MRKKSNFSHRKILQEGKNMLFDTHTHLNNDSFTDEERAVLAAEIEASEVGLVMDVGFDEPSSLLAVEHANRYPWCYAVIGMHPHDSKLMDEAMLEKFRKNRSKRAESQGNRRNRARLPL